MTVHGSKGLEFEAVHVLGLTVSSFPSSYRGVRCPPPIGMIEGTEGLSVSEEGKRNHKHEEECLFFVALSRARAHLRLHLARLQPNGNNRSPSPFLDWLPERTTVEVADPAVLPLTDDATHSTSIEVRQAAEWFVTDSELVSFEKCPRRFFYTHVLGLSGVRKTSAYLQTHDCLYRLVRWVSERRCEAHPTLAEAEAAFNTIWRTYGPFEHSYADEYHCLALQLVGTLFRNSTGMRFREIEPLAVEFTNGHVYVEPNEIADMSDGTVALRRVRTGHKRKDEYSRLEYTLYQLAGEEHFRNRAIVQALHLGDGTVDDVTISPKKLENRRERSEDMLGEIVRGWFSPKIDEVTCPRCPHFFVCAATPHGPLTLP